MRVFLVLLTFAAGCTSASGDVAGGEARFDAAPPAPPTQACSIDAEVGAATTWTALYDEYFGPSVPGSCSSEPGNCHGGTQERGFVVSRFLCTDRVACRESVLSSQSALVRLPADQAKPEKSSFVLELRRRGPTGNIVGNMPKRPACVFEPLAIERVQKWIADGAKND